MSEEEEAEEALNAQGMVESQEIRSLLEGHAVQDERLQGAVLIRYFVISDWAFPQGGRTLMTVESEGMTPWEKDGLVSAALNGEW